MVSENTNPTNILASFPKFPTLFTEKDAQTLASLQAQAKQQQDIYTQNFTPEAWANKPAAERVGLDFASGAPDLITSRFPMGSIGLTPEEADLTIQNTEAEIQELLRIQRVATRLPAIQDFMALSAIRGVLTGEEANLYELIPELDPSYSGINKLELTDTERKWFTDYAAALGTAAKSGDMASLMSLYDSFNTGLSYEDMMADMQAVNPSIDPMYILSTVALTKDAERIREALKQAYPPQVTDEVAGFTNYLWDSVKTQIATYTNPATGSPYESTGTLDGDTALLAQLGGDPANVSREVNISLEDGTNFSLVEKENGFYDPTGLVKVANKDESGNIVSLSDSELWILDNPQDDYTAITTRFRALEALGALDLTGVSDADIFTQYRTNKNTHLEDEAHANGFEDYIESLSDSQQNTFLMNMRGGMSEAASYYENNFTEEQKARWGFDVVFHYGQHRYSMENSSTSNVPDWLPDFVEAPLQFLVNFGQDAWAFGAGQLESFGSWLESARVTLGQSPDTPITDWMQGTANSMYEQLPDSYWYYQAEYAEEGFQWGQLGDVRWWGSRLGQVLPQVALILIGARVGMPILGAAGTAATGFMRAGSFIRTVSAGAIKWGSGALMMRGYESSLEAGSTYSQGLAQGMTPEEASGAANNVFWKNMALTGSDLPQLLLAMSPIKPFAGASAALRGLMRVGVLGGKMVFVGLTEGGEEVLQQAWQRQALGDTDFSYWDGEMQQVFVTGALSGLVQGVGFDALSDVVNRTKKSVPPALQDTFSETETEKSLDAALDGLARTPEGQEAIKVASEATSEALADSQIKDPSKRVFVKQIAYVEHTMEGLSEAIEKEQGNIRDLQRQLNADGVTEEEQSRIEAEIKSHTDKYNSLRSQWTEMAQEREKLVANTVELNKTNIATMWDEAELSLTQRLQLIEEAGLEAKDFYDKGTRRLKEWAKLTPEQQEAISEATSTFTGKEVVITDIASQWDNIPPALMYWKEQLCDKAGISRTAAHVPWNELTDTQKEKLLAMFPSTGTVAQEADVTGNTPSIDPELGIEKTSREVIGQDESNRVGALWDSMSAEDKASLGEYTIEEGVSTKKWNDLNPSTKRAIIFAQRLRDNVEIAKEKARQTENAEPVIKVKTPAKPKTASTILALRDWVKTNTKLTAKQRTFYLERLESISRCINRAPTGKELNLAARALMESKHYVGQSGVYQGQKVTVAEIAKTGAVKFQYEDGHISSRWVSIEQYKDIDLIEFVETLTKDALDILVTNAQAELKALTQKIGYIAPSVVELNTKDNFISPQPTAQVAKTKSARISATDWTKLSEEFKRRGTTERQLKYMHMFLNLVGSSRLNSLGIQFSDKWATREGKSSASYDADASLVTIYRHALENENVTRVVVHEIWHHLETYMHEGLVAKVQQAWKQSVLDFTKDHPWFSELYTESRLLKDLSIWSEMTQQEFNETKERARQLGLDPTGEMDSFFSKRADGTVYLNAKEYYYLYNPSEWVAVCCTQRSSELIHLAEKKGVTNVISYIQDFLKTIVEHGQELLGLGKLKVDADVLNLFTKDTQGKLVAKFAYGEGMLTQRVNVLGAFLPTDLSQINEKAATEQAKNLPDSLPEKIRPKDYAKGKTQASVAKDLASLFSAVKDNRLSVAFIGFTRSGNINLFLDNLPSKVSLAGYWNQLSKAQRLYELNRMTVKFPEGMDMTVEQLSEVPIQILEGTKKFEPIYRQLSNHKFIPWVSDKFIRSKFADSTRWNLNIMPAVDVASTIDFGKFGGEYRMNVYQVTDQGGIAKMNYEAMWARRIVDIAKRNPLLSRPSRYFNLKARLTYDTKLTHILEAIKDLSDAALPAEELLQRPDIKKAVRGFSAQEQFNMINYCKEVRASFEDILILMNQVRVRMGRPEITYRGGYVPSIRKTTMLQKAFGFGVKAGRFEEGVLPDWFSPSGTINPRAMARLTELKDYERVMDIERLLMDYVTVAAKEIFYTPMAASVKAHADVLRSKGLEVPAQWTDDWANRTLLGIPDGFTRWRMENAPRTPWAIASHIRGRLNVALFGLNPMWNLFVQTSSMALSNLHTGSYYTFLGSAQYLFNPKMRRWVKDNCPSVIYKSRASGSLMTQELQTSIMSAELVHHTPLQLVDTYAQICTTLMENTLTGMCCAAAKMKGEAMGIKDSAKLVAFASDGGAKTQSMYDTMHRPQVLSPTVAFFVPFQIFSLEALTRVREMADIHIPEKILGIKVPASLVAKTANTRAGAYRTVAANSAEGQAVVTKRLMRFAEFSVAIIIANMLGEFFNKRKPWNATSFIPFYNMIAWGFGSTGGQYDPVFTRYKDELWKGFESYIQSGEIDDFIQWAVKWHTTGGFQTSKAYRGILAVIEGEYEETEDVTDEQGNVTEGGSFEVESGDLLNAIVYGVWGTEQGEEWLRTNIEGLPESTKQILRELTECEAQLGTSVDGKWYTLGDYYSEAMHKFQDNSIPSWMVTEDVPIYSALTIFAATCTDIWEEYFGIYDPEARIQYRINHPYIDATLVFWEQVQKTRTTAATEELDTLFQLYGVANNTRMSLHGFPEIPDELKLIPE